MGNLDFSNAPGFSWYCVLLLISGIAMLGMTGVPGASRGSRIANMIFGIGFACYALYLMFMFKGDSYVIFFKAFILPVLLIIGTIKSLGEKRKAATQQPYAPPMMNYGAPQQQYGSHQAGQPQAPQNGGYYAPPAPPFPQQQPAPQGDQPQPQGQQPYPPQP